MAVAWGEDRQMRRIIVRWYANNYASRPRATQPVTNYRKNRLRDARQRWPSFCCFQIH